MGGMRTAATSYSEEEPAFMVKSNYSKEIKV